jgi:uncharacterized membrane protein
MNTNRVEAFSDGVIAIIITILVLEFNVPHGTNLAALKPLLPVFLTYVLSFAMLGIYWNNHHHLMHLTQRVSGRVLWGNLHLLFWLSLIPFVTAWMNETHRSPVPVAAYGVVLLCAAAAWSIMQAQILRHESNAELRQVIGRDWKGRVSLLAYVAALPLAFVWTGISLALFVVVALIWIVPDRRIEGYVSAASRSRE